MRRLRNDLDIYEPEGFLEIWLGALAQLFVSQEER
jgi:hypothetical protein